MNTSALAIADLETSGNVIPLPSDLRLGRIPKPEKATAQTRRQRFRILDFLNESGSRSYRVQGMNREGRYLRENFADLKAAQCRQVELEMEWLARQPQDSNVRATKLSETQLRIAEAAFVRLNADEEMMLAVNHWIEHGRNKTVVESPRLDEAAEAFLAWLEKTESIRPRTKDKYRFRVEVFRNSVPNLHVSDFTPDAIDKFLTARPVSALTKVGDRQVISRFFSWCIERPRRWATVNPCREIRIEKKVDRTPPQILSVEEAGRLLAAAESHDRGQLVPYVAVCLFGGLRPAEAERLTWENVNLADGEIRIESQSTKTKLPRVVSIGDTLQAWLAAYEGMPFRPPNLRRGLDAIKPLAGYTGRVGAAGENLKPWPHDVLRHTAISHYFRKTGSYGQTAEQFGNSEAIIKAHYQGRVSSADTKKFYDLLPMKGASK